MPTSRLCQKCRRTFPSSSIRRGRCPRCLGEDTAGKKNRRGQGRDPIRRKVYDSKRWRTFTRPTVLIRDGFECVGCGRVDLTGRALVADHKTPIEELLAQGRDPWDPAECQTLCQTCSGRKDGGRSHA